MQHIKHNAMTAIAVLMFTTNTFAQSSDVANRPCPSVSVSCVSSKYCFEDPYEFRADVSGASSDLKLSFEWTVVGGRIINGQGTPQITVVGDRTRRMVSHEGRWVEEMVLDPITAVVKLTGGPAECAMKLTASISFLNERNVPPISIVDEFGRLSFQPVKPRLDNFAMLLRNHPLATGYIVSEGEWPLEKRAMVYLVETKQIDAARLHYVQRNKTKDLNIKLFLVPPGATPPK
jgi:hypothetical protein